MPAYPLWLLTKLLRGGGLIMPTLLRHEISGGPKKLTNKTHTNSETDGDEFILKNIYLGSSQIAMA